MLIFFSQTTYSSPIVPGTLMQYSTRHSIGIEWNVTGDTDHDAACNVQFRRVGETEWKNFVSLFRVDYLGHYGGTNADAAYNMLAGSVMFLQPGTAYEIKLDLVDPDGGDSSTIISLATRTIPATVPTGGTFHVVPGTGGGTGTQADPFQGLDAATAAAARGGVFLLHAGDYNEYTFRTMGSEGGYIVWRAAGDGPVVFSKIEVYGSYNWFDSLTFIHKNPEDTRGLVSQGAAIGNVVTYCNFTGYNYAINLKEGADYWYISDNTIVGDKVDFQIPGDFGGEGIELNHTSGHTVSYNRISLVSDGVSYPHRNCDIFGNDIFNVSDDGIEPDYGYANNRMWGNRITNANNHDFSFQPMYCGPWYIIGNQTAGTTQSILKYRIQDRFLLAHNTFMGWGTLLGYGHHILSSLSRNNLWIIGGGDGYIWEGYTCSDPENCISPDRFAPDWRSDVDYDGFDWNGSGLPFKWGINTDRYADLSTFVAATGIEQNGVVVDKNEIFEPFTYPETEGGLVDLQTFTLQGGSNAVDAGDLLPGINDNYLGTAPDLGAHEFGGPAAHYGPRNRNIASNGFRAETNQGIYPFLIRSRPGGVVLEFKKKLTGATRVQIYNTSGALQQAAVTRAHNNLRITGLNMGVYYLSVNVMGRNYGKMFTVFNAL